MCISWYCFMIGSWLLQGHNASKRSTSHGSTDRVFWTFEVVVPAFGAVLETPPLLRILQVSWLWLVEFQKCWGGDDFADFKYSSAKLARFPFVWDFLGAWDLNRVRCVCWEDWKLLDTKQKKKMKDNRLEITSLKHRPGLLFWWSGVRIESSFPVGFFGTYCDYEIGWFRVYIIRQKGRLLHGGLWVRFQDEHQCID